MEEKSIYGAKVVLLGHQNVGKTCLGIRYVENRYDDTPPESTIGAAFMTKTVEMDRDKVKFEIWDTAGQERFRSFAPMYYRNAAAAVVVYDVGSQEAKEIHAEELEEASERLTMLQANHAQAMILREKANETTLSQLKTEEDRVKSLETQLAEKVERIAVLEAELKRVNEETTEMLAESMAQLERVEKDRDSLREQLSKALSQSRLDVAESAKSANEEQLAKFEQFLAAHVEAEIARLERQREELRRCGNDPSAILAVLGAVQSDRTLFETALKSTNNGANLPVIPEEKKEEEKKEPKAEEPVVAATTTTTVEEKIEGEVAAPAAPPTEEGTEAAPKKEEEEAKAVETEEKPETVDGENAAEANNENAPAAAAPEAAAESQKDATTPAENGETPSTSDAALPPPPPPATTSHPLSILTLSSSPSPLLAMLELRLRLAAQENVVIALESLVSASSVAAENAAKVAEVEASARASEAAAQAAAQARTEAEEKAAKLAEEAKNNGGGFGGGGGGGGAAAAALLLAASAGGEGADPSASVSVSSSKLNELLEENAGLRERLKQLQAALASGEHPAAQAIDTEKLDEDVPQAVFPAPPPAATPAPTDNDPAKLRSHIESMESTHRKQLEAFKEAAMQEAAALRQRMSDLTIEHEMALANIRSVAEESAEELQAARNEVEELVTEMQQVRDAADEREAQLRQEISDLEEQVLSLEEDKRRAELSDAAIERERMEAELQASKEAQEALLARMKEAEENAASVLSAEAQAQLQQVQNQLEESQRAMVERQANLQVLAAKEEEMLKMEEEMQEKARQRKEEIEKEKDRLEEEKKRVAQELEERKAALADKRSQAEAKQNELTKAIDRAPVRTVGRGGVGAAASGGKGGGGADPAQVRELESQLKEANRKLKFAEKKAEKDAEAIKKLEQQIARGGGGGGSGAGGGDRDLKMAQKKWDEQQKKQTKEMEKEKAISKKAKEQLEQSQQEVVDLTKQNKSLTTQLAEVGRAAEELAAAKDREQGLIKKQDELETDLKNVRAERDSLEADYKKEVALRKKYYNIIEDMKGKIRVYCRCRPMNKKEREMNCKQSVAWPDDMTIEVTTAKDTKSFTFDECFQPSGSNSLQEKVCEPTLHLVQSAIDGYNVCIFAYGQTGSGKTFTMYGPSDNPGVAPRVMRELYSIIEREQNTLGVEVSCYMLELYNDQLVDLLAEKSQKGKPIDPKAGEEALKIKQDARGVVFVQGAVVRPAANFQELEKWNQIGFDSRHVASTQMNAESSRSHLIFSILINATNKQTGTKTIGKITLVDLAGSERVSKTGATADRLKEATSINKSLSALGDVISALSSGGDKGKHVPYRNNKLTMLLQDGIGGNAKTLMFVNISPADYNCDETTTSLVYASRVKLITNSAEKEKESKEVARLKAIIEQLKAGGGGGGGAAAAALLDDRPPTPPQPEANVEDGEMVDGY